MTTWAIYRVDTGELVQAAFVSDTHPRFNGFAWEVGVHAALSLATRADPAIQSWSPTAKAFVDDTTKVDAVLLPLIDAQREALQMTVLTPGGAKKYVYNRKADEAISASGIAATVLNALSLVERKKKYPFAFAESALTGEPLSVVLARFEIGMIASAVENARIEAVAQKAKRDIKAATTATAKRAAYAAINWNWSV